MCTKYPDSIAANRSISRHMSCLAQRQRPNLDAMATFESEPFGPDEVGTSFKRLHDKECLLLEL